MFKRFRINACREFAHFNFFENLTIAESFFGDFLNLFRYADTLQTAVSESTCANFFNLCFWIEFYAGHFVTSAESIKPDCRYRLGEFERFKTFCICKSICLNSR